MNAPIAIKAKIKTTPTAMPAMAPVDNPLF
jgi:hypothetical protein